MEDADWEQNPDVGHNRYCETLQQPNDYTFLMNSQSMSNFCLGCHYGAHFRTQDSTGSIWIRHPILIRLPTTGEFGDYNPETSYDATVPVGWLNPTTPTRNDAVVMCLSCHRAHGSQYPDMLRWDYSGTMTAGGGDSNEGCFKCHSGKDTHHVLRENSAHREILLIQLYSPSLTYD